MPKAKDSRFPPLDLLRQVSTALPGAWDALDALHASNLADGCRQWPAWCYAPISVCSDVVAHTARSASTRELLALLYEAFALAPWRQSKEVYRFDPELAEILQEQVGDALDFPAEVLYSLPYPSVYIQAPGLSLGDTPVHGFWASLEYDQRNGAGELRFLLLIDGDPLRAVPLYLMIGQKTLSESLQVFARDAAGAHQLGIPPEIAKAALQRAYGLLPLIGYALQLVLYLCTVNAEVDAAPSQATTYRRGPVVKDRFAEVRQWDVGVRIGAAIRAHQVSAPDGSDDDPADQEGAPARAHASPRPHIRRGHWHHYWTGPRSQPAERKLILRWTAPMLIGGDPQDEDPDARPVTIHPVK